LYIPYLPYARQDKEVSNETTFALSVFIDLLNVMMFRRVIIFDPHNYEAVSKIYNVEIIKPYQEIQNAFIKTESDVICFPDKGAKDRYGEKLSHDGYPSVMANKVRDQVTGRIIAIALERDVCGKKVLIVDDLCDGGATFILLAKEMQSAKSISLYVSHGIFSKGVDVLRQGGINRIFTKDGEIN